MCLSFVRPGWSWLPYRLQVFVGKSCPPLGEIGGCVVPPRALCADFATATPLLQKFACSDCVPAQVRGPCRFARVLPRRDGLGPTKKRMQQVRLFPSVRFAGILCVVGNVAPRKERCAWSVCRNLHDCAGAS